MCLLYFIVNYLCYGRFKVCTISSTRRTNKGTISSLAIVVLVLKCFNTAKWALALGKYRPLVGQQCHDCLRKLSWDGQIPLRVSQ
jgi:hypothetical protein